MQAMKSDNLIDLNAFCINHDVEVSFISLLQKNGLVEVTTFEEKAFLEVDQLKQVEQFTRLYYELDINMEGIETVAHLLERVHEMQDEITTLKNRLRLYEPAAAVVETIE